MGACAKTIGLEMTSATNRTRRLIRPPLFLCVLLDRPWPNFCAVNVAGRVDRDSFRRAGAGEIRSAACFGIGDEAGHLAVLDAAVPDAALPAGVVLRHRFRFRVGDVQTV